MTTPHIRPHQIRSRPIKAQSMQVAVLKMEGIRWYVLKLAVQDDR